MGTFPQTTTRGEGVVTDGVDKGSAAAAAIAAGEKNMVALLPAGEERIQHRAHEVLPFFDHGAQWLYYKHRTVCVSITMDKARLTT